MNKKDSTKIKCIVIAKILKESIINTTGPRIFKIIQKIKKGGN